MKSVLVIFNGIKFPFYLMEHSIAQAKSRNASLHALFLKGKKDDSEGYGFPSDLAQAEVVTNSGDAKEDDEKIIRDNMKLAKDMTETENVSFTAELRKDSSLSEIIEIIKPFDLICLDAAFDDETPAMLTNKRFTSSELMEQSSSPIKLISEDK